MNPVKTKALIRSNVEKISRDKDSFTISFNGARIIGNCGLGKEVAEKITYLKNPDELKADKEKNILFSNSALNMELYTDIINKGYKGIIVPSVASNFITKIMGKEQFKKQTR